MKHDPTPSPWFQKPIWQGLLGLVLLLGGWKLATYRPAADEDARLADVRGMAEDEAELATRLDRVSRNLRGDPPYQFPGRLVLVAGLVLFVSAGVRMYQSAPAPPVAEEADNPLSDDHARMP